MSSPFEFHFRCGKQISLHMACNGRQPQMNFHVSRSARHPDTLPSSGVRSCHVETALVISCYLFGIAAHYYYVTIGPEISATPQLQMCPPATYLMCTTFWKTDGPLKRVCENYMIYAIAKNLLPSSCSAKQIMMSFIPHWPMASSNQSLAMEHTNVSQRKTHIRSGNTF